MPYLKVIITTIQIASGAHFANPEGLVYSEQNLADGSIIVNQQPLPLCEGDDDNPCVTYRNGDAHAFLSLNGCPDADEPVNPKSPITIIQKENRKCWIQYTDASGKQINETIDEDTDGNGPCASGRAFINNSCLPLPYILKGQVESGAMPVKEWRREMDEWKQYWKTHPKQELHGCKDSKGFDTGLCVKLPREKNDKPVTQGK